jgi:hypothetical protein
VAALGQPNFSRIAGVIKTLGLTNTFSNPGLKLTVFVPTNAVSKQRTDQPRNCPFAACFTLRLLTAAPPLLPYIHSC